MTRLIKALKMSQSFSESVTKVLFQMQKLSSTAPGSGATLTTDKSVRPFTVLVEGNIGSGKTTYLNHFTKFQQDIDIVMEPVEEWRNLNNKHNLLQMMYEDPGRWSLMFQTYVQLTMLKNHTRISHKPVKMMERSLFSAKYCFAENLRRSGKMPESEYQVLTKWFDYMINSPQINLSVDLIVYLKVKLT